MVINQWHRQLFARFSLIGRGGFLGLGKGWFPAGVIGIIAGMLWPVAAAVGIVVIVAISGH